MDEPYAGGASQEILVSPRFKDTGVVVKQDTVIERFLDNVWAERGLSDNSLQSYRHDLLHLQNCLAIRNKTPQSGHP